MSLAAFALVAAEFLPVSLLRPIAADLRISDGQAGQAISISGLFVLVTSFFSSSLAERLDHKLLLMLLTLLMIVSATVVASAPNYAIFMFGRALIGISIGGFRSMSAATAMRLVPEHQVPRALVIVNGGNALATALAAPLGSFLGAIVGWGWAFFCVVPVAVIALGWKWVGLPSMKAERGPNPGNAFKMLARPLGHWAWRHARCSSWVSSRATALRAGQQSAPADEGKVSMAPRRNGRGSWGYAPACYARLCESCRPRRWWFTVCTSRRTDHRYTARPRPMEPPRHASTKLPHAATRGVLVCRWSVGLARIRAQAGAAVMRGCRVGQVSIRDRRPVRPWLVVNPGEGTAAPWASWPQPSSANNFPAAARLPRAANSLRFQVLHYVATASGAASPSPAGRITTRTRWARTLFNRKEKTSWPTSAPSPQTKTASPARCAP
ncbi:MFS transporter [Xanthomonas euvesicatoria]|uniref:MFS transporter n=1 Tax=Xanthomonas euvesicatoria TaxID=456327 RepID=UPI001E2EE990|nr:MFS transporter [Xanthomonas euvesicatoria]